MAQDIIALIDGSVYSASVCELAGWVAQRNHWPVRLLHVLPPPPAPRADLSGSIRLGARTALLTELAALDEQRARLALAQGRAILDDAQALLIEAGVTDISARLRHGDVVEAVTDCEAAAGLIVIGKRGETANRAPGHLGSNLERVVRASSLPVLVAAREHRDISRVLIAYDGGPSARRAIDRVAQLHAYQGLAVEIASVGAAPGMDAARDKLAEVGIVATTTVLEGEPERVLLAHLDDSGADVLVMGAYGHSRMRRLIVGSTTTAMLRQARVPVLLVR